MEWVLTHTKRLKINLIILYEKGLFIQYYAHIASEWRVPF
jgi:hypothetical protein